MVEHHHNDALLPYMVGGLLYTPATNTGVAEKIKNGRIPCLTSIALCLEDAVLDEALEYAEGCLKNTVSELAKLDKEKLPMIFARVRTPIHLLHIHELLGENEQALTGYVLPKFDPENAEEYAKLISQFNGSRTEKLYIMPIIESGTAADISHRTETLLEIKAVLDKIKEYVLNVRVGGNDFSSLYGLRRSVSQNIYEIGVIRDILSDIINVFASDHVVSGAVWEYFGTDMDADWAKGLKRELELDKLNGFIGKTAIHPSQLPIIYESMKPSRADYDDARSILSWNDGQSGVAKSADSSRMNEIKCHKKWAERIVRLAEVYGIRDE
ncbi:MAG: HpcH/HpaI aldolase/citrate lyase family protein [Oscillospiraceae bacterium]|nr:HpcH/HpaI aldolase/citrate lyase family protein [Oscillospiraceae bacterium]